MPNYSRKRANEHLEQAWKDEQSEREAKWIALRDAERYKGALERLCKLYGIHDSYFTENVTLFIDGVKQDRREFRVDRLVEDLDILDRVDDTEGARKRLGLTKEEA